MCLFISENLKLRCDKGFRPNLVRFEINTVVEKTLLCVRVCVCVQKKATSIILVLFVCVYVLVLWCVSRDVFSLNHPVVRRTQSEQCICSIGVIVSDCAEIDNILETETK